MSLPYKIEKSSRHEKILQKDFIKQYFTDVVWGAVCAYKINTWDLSRKQCVNFYSL